MSDDELQITTADMLEIVAGGGNGVEYVDVCGLIETAAKELREKDKDISNLREALKPFVNATVIDLTCNGENFVKAVVVSEDDILCARTILEGATKCQQN